MSTEKPKMGCIESLSSRNSKVTQFLQLCIQPETDKELEGVLLKYWEKFESLPRREDFSEIDVVCMFVLNHAYKKRNVSLSAMSRSLFAYQRQVQVKFFRNPAINPSTDCFLKELRNFTNLYTYSKCDQMLVDVGLGSILDGGLGLTLFLMKFGLMEFPAEANAKGRKMVEMLVFGFNGFIDGAAGVRTNIEFEELLHRIRRSDISFRRALMILCIVVIVTEYEVQVKMEAMFNLPSSMQQMRNQIMLKLKCINLVISATNETKIILRDIEKFLGKILSALIHGAVSRLIMETARKLFHEVREFHNPRFLKDLARCKIRSSLRKRSMLSEQVNQLVISDDVKDYLLFQREDIWELLKENHVFHNIDKKLKESLFF